MTNTLHYIQVLCQTAQPRQPRQQQAGEEYGESGGAAGGAAGGEHHLESFTGIRWDERLRLIMSLLTTDL